MRDIEEDKHEITSGYVLANKRILNQEQLLLGVLRKKKGWKEQSNWHRQKKAESWQERKRSF